MYLSSPSRPRHSFSVNPKHDSMSPRQNKKFNLFNSPYTWPGFGNEISILNHARLEIYLLHSLQTRAIFPRGGRRNYLRLYAAASLFRVQILIKASGALLWSPAGIWRQPKYQEESLLSLNRLGHSNAYGPAHESRKMKAIFPGTTVRNAPHCPGTGNFSSMGHVIFREEIWRGEYTCTYVTLCILRTTWPCHHYSSCYSINNWTYPFILARETRVLSKISTNDDFSHSNVRPNELYEFT